MQLPDVPYDEVCPAQPVLGSAKHIPMNMRYTHPVFTWAACDWLHAYLGFFCVRTGYRDTALMMQIPDEHEHYSQRAPWLRAGVLGANDGLVSVASLMLGVEGGTNELHGVVLAGVAGLVAGALSMAVGEFVSVSSQRCLLCPAL